MKKILKIAGITLASIVGLALIAVVVAVAVVTSSGRLTDLVKKYAPEFVNCEIKLEKADLTLIKTFPNIGLEIDHVALLNPMEGTSDTLANIDKLIVSADAKRFLNDKEIVVKQCILDHAFVNVFFDAEGNSNLNVFNVSESEDSTSSSFNYLVDLEEVKMNDTRFVYEDLRSDMRASTDGLNLRVKGKMTDNDIDADLDMSAASLAFTTPSLKAFANDFSLGYSF